VTIVTDGGGGQGTVPRRQCVSVTILMLTLLCGRQDGSSVAALTQA
jgi:hypothetical protein